MTLIGTFTTLLRHRLLTKNCIPSRNFTLATEEKIGDVEDDKSEDKLDKICNKSRLAPQHRNLLFDKRPFPQPVDKVHETLKYNRKLYGTFGSKSGINPGIMWPTKSEVHERKEFEKVAYPYTINEMVDIEKSKIQAKEKEREETEKRIMANMAKLGMWKKQLNDTIAKRQAEALAAKEKKEKLIEEVRRHFGFRVDPKEDRFKEMLALKEKEMKKKEKQARSEEREKIALAKLMEKHKVEQN